MHGTAPALFTRTSRLDTRPLLSDTFTAMPTLYETLRADIITAVKARDSGTATILRTNDGAIQRAAMDLNKPIDDALVLTTLRKAVKNLTDANVDFAKAGRIDLVTANEHEIGIIQKYLPRQFDAARLETLVAEAIAASAATTKKEMGKVIAVLKAHPEAGLIDFGAVSKIIQAKLV
jgi:uncharacterized protein